MAFGRTGPSRRWGSVAYDPVIGDPPLDRWCSTIERATPRAADPPTALGSTVDSTLGAVGLPEGVEMSSEEDSIDSRSRGAAELAPLISGIQIGMVILPDANGTLAGRPLIIQDEDFNGSLWFLVSRSANWTSGVTGEVQANVALVDVGHSTWVSLSGLASLVEDRERVERMWSGTYAAWFDGPDDPDLILLHFHATDAEYWDSRTNQIIELSDISD